MKITIYGTRGSYPVCGAKIIRYGGNTTCFYIEYNDEKIIVDGGSGIVKLGDDIMLNSEYFGSEFNILVTHTHWDHIMGFPYFRPFYYKGYKINVTGSDAETMKLQDVFYKQHNRINHPVPFESLKADMTFNEISAGDDFSLGVIKIKTYQLNHPGKDLGYRFETDNGIFVILTDLAVIENNYLAIGFEKLAKEDSKKLERDYYEGLVEFIRGADLVLHDTNFTEEEIQNKRHWGHSSPLDALNLLSEHNSSPALVLSHHDPFHNDRDMDEIYKNAKRKGKDMGIDVLIAKEGGSFIL